MRPTSLLGAAAAVLTGLTLAVLPACALPSPLHTSTTHNGPPANAVHDLGFESPAETLRELSDGMFNFGPRFEITQPVGTSPTYHRDPQNRPINVNFTTSGGELRRRVAFLYNHAKPLPDGIMIEDIGRDGMTVVNNARIQIHYDDESDLLLSFWIATPRGIALLTAWSNGDGTHHISSTVLGSGATQLLMNVRLWDNASDPVVIAQPTIPDHPAVHV